MHAAVIRRRRRISFGMAAGPSITAAGSVDTASFEIGVTATITAGTATATGGGTVTYEFRHTASGVDVSGGLAAYAYTGADDTEAGLRQWRAVETGGTNPGATAWQTLSSGTIAYAAPVNTVAPAISGTTGFGDLLTATTGTWTGSNISYSYQWQRGGLDISGATASTYTLTLADSGASITCDVTATNSGGAVLATSNTIVADAYSIPVITGVPTISGTVEVGQLLTATAASVAGSPTPTRTWQWERAGVPIGGATASTYTLVAADDGSTITVVQTETNAVGADTAESAQTATVTYTAPVAARALADQSFTENTGVQTLDASVDFTGSAITYSLDTSLTGVTINSGSGVVSFDTDVLAIQSGTVVTVRGTNSGGFDTSSFNLAITAAGDTTAPVLSGLGFTDSTDTIAITSDEGGTAFWVADTSSTVPTGAQVVAGQGADSLAADASGSNAVVTGANNFTGDVSALTSGNYYIYLVVRDAALNISAVSSLLVTVDNTAPIISGVSATSGNAQISFDWSTDTGAGTARVVAIAQGAAAPSAAQILAGTDAADVAALGDSGNITVTASGAQTQQVISPLTNGTAYDLYVAHDDGNSNTDTDSALNVTPATVPSQFGAGDWSVATGSGASEIDVTLTTLPAANGASITDVEYDVDSSGTWISLPSYAGTGTYTITMAAAGTSYDIRVRAVNSVGNATASAVKAATSGAAAGGGITLVGSPVEVRDPHPSANPLVASITPTNSANTIIAILQFESGGTSLDTSIDTGGGNIPTLDGTAMQVARVAEKSRRHCAIYGLQAGAATSIDCSVSPANGLRGASLVLQEVSGVNNTTIFNGAGDNSPSTDTASPSLTTTDADGLLIGGATFGEENVAASVVTGTILGTEAPTGTADGLKDVRVIAATAPVAAAGATEGLSFTQVGNISATSVVAELNPA